jgi:hypothetical protein
MIKYILIISSLFLISCKQGETIESVTVSDELPIQLEWDGSECEFNESTVTSNRLVVIGSSMAYDIGQKMADRLGKTLVNHASVDSTLVCQLHVVRNAKLQADDVILYIVGETDMRLGYEFWKIDDDLYDIRSILDGVENETIITVNTPKMLPYSYAYGDPLNQGSTPLAYQYRDPIKNTLDLFRYKHVDLTVLWTPLNEYFIDGIRLNDAGKDAVVDIIYNNY